MYSVYVYTQWIILYPNHNIPATVSPQDSAAGSTSLPNCTCAVCSSLSASNSRSVSRRNTYTPWLASYGSAAVVCEDVLASSARIGSCGFSTNDCKSPLSRSTTTTPRRSASERQTLRVTTVMSAFCRRWVLTTSRMSCIGVFWDDDVFL